MAKSKGKGDPRTAKAVQQMLRKTGKPDTTPVTIGPFKKGKR